MFAKLSLPVKLLSLNFSANLLLLVYPPLLSLDLHFQHQAIKIILELICVQHVFAL